MSKLLTKSKFLNGLDADALLWRVVNQPESIPQPDAFTQFIFDNGTAVGVLAQQYFEKGIDLTDFDFIKNIEQTQAALAHRQPIFEAGFLSHRFYARVDILLPVDDDHWDIIEVKSSTKQKDIHVWDLAFQQFVLEQSGLKIRQTKVMLINNQYVKQGDLSIQDLFYFENVTHLVNEFLPKIPDLAENMLKVMDLPACPEFDMKELFKGEYSNVFRDEFLANLPKGSVFDFYGMSKKKALDLWLSGFKMLKDVPETIQINSKQRIQKETAISGKPYINPTKIREFIDELQYPIYHLDFETFNPAVPIFDGTKPYMHLPFQYSLHIEQADGTIEHKAYLHTETTDPRVNLFEQLRQDIGEKGSILVYYEPFEKSRIKEWAAVKPEDAEWAEGLLNRTRDLMQPFGDFHYYHPDQQGSCSIKNVLPVLSDLTYEGMPIADGGQAMSAYSSYFIHQNPHENRGELIQNMLDYCEQDTWAMVLILRKLKELSTNSI